MSAFVIHRLTSSDTSMMREMTNVLGQAFGEVEAYSDAQPSAEYLKRLLSGDSFIALAAVKNCGVVGGLAAYELRKFEQQRSEIYIYDLAIAAAHRQQGIATALIAELKKVAADRGAYVIYVQADLQDVAAIALYTKIGSREDVLHFDIKVEIEKSNSPTKQSGGENFPRGNPC